MQQKYRRFSTGPVVPIAQPIGIQIIYIRAIRHFFGVHMETTTRSFSFREIGEEKLRKRVVWVNKNPQLEGPKKDKNFLRKCMNWKTDTEKGPTWTVCGCTDGRTEIFS